MFLRRRRWEHQRNINEESNKRVELHIDFLCLQSISLLQFFTLLCSTIIHCRRCRPRSLNLSTPNLSHSHRLPHPNPHPNPNPNFIFFYIFFHLTHHHHPCQTAKHIHHPDDDTDSYTLYHHTIYWIWFIFLIFFLSLH